MFAAFLNSIVLVFLLMVFTFLIAQKIKNNSIVDIVWGFGFVLIAWFVLINFSNFNAKQIVLTILVSIWGLRLTIYIFNRNKNQPEDFRYVEMRESWGNNQTLFAFFQVFMLQGFLMLLIALPIICINTKNAATTNFSILDIPAIILWLFGFYFEVAADSSLKKFRSNPKNSGKILKAGVWSKCRHPNYFGEFCMIWAIFLFALSCKCYLTIISPLLLSFLLLRVSGTPYLERRYEGHKEYEIYKKNTPIFFPKLFK